MSCDCTKFGHLELYREEITERIKQSIFLKRSLEIIAKREDDASKLLKCPACEQFWQSSWAWNWGDKEYLFKVPEIEIVSWVAEPYVQPDELLIYSASMANYLKKSKFVERDMKCLSDGCSDPAVLYSVFCKKHHIASLQNAGALPKMPTGRWFAPYEQS
jgi:hypothetical protein